MPSHSFVSSHCVPRLWSFFCLSGCHQSVANGKLYTVGSGDDEVPLVHLYGSAYEKGYAHGLLEKQRMSSFVNSVWNYLEDQVEQAINGSLPTNSSIPPATLQWIANVGLEIALDLTSDMTKAYTGIHTHTHTHTHNYICVLCFLT